MHFHFQKIKCFPIQIQGCTLAEIFEKLLGAFPGVVLGL